MESIQKMGESFAVNTATQMMEKLAPVIEEAKKQPDTRSSEEKISVQQRSAEFFKGVYFATKEKDVTFIEEYAQKYLGKSHSTLQGENGGYLVETVVADYIRELATDYGVARRLPTQYPMSSLKEILPTLASGAVAYWVGEGNNATASSATLAAPELSAKQLIGLTVASNVSLKAAKANLGAFIAKQLAIAIAQKEDNAYLNGTGSNPDITGIMVDEDIPEINLGTGNTDFADVTPEKLHEVVMSLNTALHVGAKWTMSGVALLALMNLKDGEERPLFQSLQNPIQRTLLGFPVEVSSVAPSTEGANKPIMTFGNHELAGVFGEFDSPTLEVSSEASILIPGPATINLFQSNQSATRIVEQVDYKTVLPNALVRLMTGPALSS